MSTITVKQRPPNLDKIKKKHSLRKRIVKDRYLIMLLAPAMLYFFIFKYGPMFGIMISFKDYNPFLGVWDSKWVGLKFYRMFFNNPDGWEIIRNTFLLGFYKLFWGFPAPIILALLLNEMRIKMYKRVIQTISYLPHFISTVVVASMVTMFLSPTSGIINEFIGFFGFEPVNFLMEPKWFRTVYVASEIWTDVGWGTIIYLAALSGVNPSLYEAAEIDGANRWRQTWHVTLPGIAPAITILLILNIGRMIEIGFEKVYLLTNPVTYETGDIISTYVYRVGLVQGNFSYGTAIDIFMGIISLVFIYSANYISRKVSDTSLW